ncbi:lipase/acyltransferase domain-containing protein [Candidatus Nitrospira bockiana]
MTGRTCISLLLMLVVGCTAADVPGPAGARVSSVVIVVPGYYGSKLVRVADGKLVWISALQAVLGDHSLALPLPGLDVQDAVPLRPDGVLEKISIVPLLYSVDGYGAILQALRASAGPGTAVVGLSYDWRADLMEAVRSLDATIQAWQASGAGEIRIVAHSLGGLITAYYLRYGTQPPGTASETWAGAELVKAAVLVGVPFKGTMIALRNSLYGEAIGWNRTLLTATAVASFPSTYHLLPSAEADVLLDRDLRPVHGAIRDARNWTVSEWGLLAGPSLTKDVRERREAYTRAWLSRSQRFVSLLFAPQSVAAHRSLSLLSVVGTGQPTLATGVWAPTAAGSQRTVIFEGPQLAAVVPGVTRSMLYRDGDGTVTTASAALPPPYAEAFPVTVRRYQVSHSELVARPDILQEIIAFLHADEERG